jgi:hypothetical protein
VWLYLYILDRCDWEHGAVIEWRDKDEAAELGMPLSTLRWQRKKLQEAGYIVTERHGNKLRIIVQKWVDPREYTDRTHAEGVATSCDTEDARVTTRVTTRVTSEMGQSEAHIKELKYSHITKEEAAQQSAARRALFTAISKTCKADPKTSRTSLGKVASVLEKAGYTPEDVEAFGKDWWGTKGMRQRPPTIWQLQERIGIVRAKKEEDKPKDYFVAPSMRVRET